MSCCLTKGSSVLRRERKIGLKKEDASGCKRGEMKSRGAEMRLPREKEKKERLEKLKRGREELRKRKRDVLILRKSNKRKEKKRGRLRRDLPDRKMRRGRRCRREGIKMVVIEVDLGEVVEAIVKMMVQDQEEGEELGNLAKEAGGIENRASVMNGLDHVAEEEEIGTEMIEIGCLQDVVLLLEIVMVLIVDPAVMIVEMMALLNVVDRLQDAVSPLQEIAGGVEAVVKTDLHVETTLLPVVDETKMIEVECGEVVVATVIVMMVPDVMTVLDQEEAEVELGDLEVEVGEIESREEMTDPGMMTAALEMIAVHVTTVVLVAALNVVALEMMTTDPQ